MLQTLILKSIKFYQYFISPNFSNVCRFYPSCSQYCVLAIRKYGLIDGLWKAARRVSKCHPWSLGGEDLP